MTKNTDVARSKRPTGSSVRLIITRVAQLYGVAKTRIVDALPLLYALRRHEAETQCEEFAYAGVALGPHWDGIKGLFRYVHVAVIVGVVVLIAYLIYRRTWVMGRLGDRDHLEVSRKRQSSENLLRDDEM